MVADVDMDLIRMAAREAAHEAASKILEEERKHAPAYAAQAIDAYFKQYGLGPDHWVSVRLRYEDERKNWSTVRIVVIGTLVTAALIFGGDRLQDWFIAKVVAASDHRTSKQPELPETQ